jgi:hypothetical protein
MRVPHGIWLKLVLPPFRPSFFNLSTYLSKKVVEPDQKMVLPHFILNLKYT